MKKLCFLMMFTLFALLIFSQAAFAGKDPAFVAEQTAQKYYDKGKAVMETDPKTAIKHFKSCISYAMKVCDLVTISPEDKNKNAPVYQKNLDYIDAGAWLAVLAYARMGSIYYTKGDEDNAAKHYGKAVDICENTMGMWREMKQTERLKRWQVLYDEVNVFDKKK